MCAKLISEDMMDEILASGPKQYFFQKEEDGEVTIIFTSDIHIVEPGETDVLGRIWTPPTADANGNPILDRNGKPRQPWTKVEAEATVKGSPVIYAFGSREGILLKAWIAAIRENEIKKGEFAGTKWTCMKSGKWNWIIKYEGREDVSSPSPKTNIDTSGVSKTLSDLKVKNKDVSKGVDKIQLIKTLAILTGKTQKELEEMWPLLIKQNVIGEKDGKVLVL